MDEFLQKALDFSNYNYTLSTQRKVLKEKLNAQLTYGFNGGIFIIDQSLITFTNMLIEQGRTSGVIILDANNNPVMIDDLQQFKDEIFDRYFDSVSTYYEEYNKIKKNRSVEKLTDL